jgi:serine/threonine-protein kinase
VSGEIPPAIGDFPAGSQIASYQIQELVGRGGMAVVYRAVDVRLGRLVALKVLAIELATDDAFRQRFIRESRAGAAVDHPNVIPVFEAGEADGVLFIAMRYVTGQDVRALIERDGRLRASRTVSIVTQVASALDAAHAHGLIHRDVKPANMLLAGDGDGRTPDHVYLSDFGLSKQSVTTASLTATGQFLGTLDYMSPEQVEGRPIDGRTDQYALACAAFEMLAGQPPFRREQNLAVLWAQVSAQPPSVLQWRPDLPPAVDEVIAKALAKSPADRYASCLEFATALRLACASRQGEREAQAAPAGPDHGPATEMASGSSAGGLGLAAAAARPPVPLLPPGPGEAAAAALGQEATVTELTPEVGQRAASGYRPASGHQHGGAGPGYQAGATGPGYQAGSGYQGPGSGYQGGGPGYQGGGSGYQSPGSGYQGGAGSGFQAGGAGPGYQGGDTPLYPGGGPGFGPPGMTDPRSPGVPGYPPAGPPRRRGKGLPVFFGIAVVLALAAAAVLVLHIGNHLLGGNPTPTPGTVSSTPTRGSASQSASPSPSPTQQSAPPLRPAAVVRSYFTAINNHRYLRAWNINVHQHSLQTYTSFRQGYAQTQFDAVTVVGVSGGVVSIQLAAHQTDGTVKYFHGTYTVSDGVIVGSSILPG